MIKIPYSILPFKVLKQGSKPFFSIAEIVQHFFIFLELNLRQAEMDVKPIEYVAMVILSTITFFIFMFLVLFMIFFSLEFENPISITIMASLFISFFVFLSGMMYPKLLANRRIKDLEKNLLPALRTLLIQINSGVPLFDVLVEISSEDYGEISKVFNLTVKEINAGKSQIEALDELATNNPSLFFRRAIWQLVNGMKSGAKLNNVIKQVIYSLSQEQLIEIQKYGSQLNPLAMFYMMIAVILPSLGMTFMLMLSTLFFTSEFLAKTLFWSLYGIVFFFQLMFLGVIKSKRPNLLGD